MIVVLRKDDGGGAPFEDDDPWLMPDDLDEGTEPMYHASTFAMRATLQIEEKSAIERIFDLAVKFFREARWARLPLSRLAQLVTAVAGGSPLGPSLPGVAERVLRERLIRERTLGWMSTVVREAEMPYSQGLVGVRLQAAKTFAREAAKQTAFGGLGLRWAPPDPNQRAALEVRALSQVRRLSRGTKEGMLEILDEALQVGLNPLDTARYLAQHPGFGLTGSQVKAVRAYRRALEEGKWSEARRRLLHPTRAARPKNAARVEALVAQYTERMRRYRANTIARTEALASANEGARMIWQDVIARGELPSAVALGKRWVVAPDGATSGRIGRGPKTEGPCPYCLEIAALNAATVGFDEPFQTPDGPLDLPPAHPNCRCIVFYAPRFESRRAPGVLLAG